MAPAEELNRPGGGHIASVAMSLEEEEDDDSEHVQDEYEGRLTSEPQTGKMGERKGSASADGKRKARGTHESSRFSTDSGMLTAIEASSQNGPERRIAGTGVSSEVRRL